MKTPRKNQRMALSAMAAAVKGIISQPTGAGKTDIQIWSILREIEDRNYGFSVSVLTGPKIILMQQHLREFSRVIVPALSGKSHVKFLAVHSGEEDSEELNQLCADNGLAELGLENTTTVDVIVRKILHAQKFNYPIILISTYHSADRIIEALTVMEIMAAIVNHDEAHHLGGEESDGRFSHLPQAFDKVCLKQYFFTATPVRTKSDKGTGMDNTKFGGLLQDAYYKPCSAILDGICLRPRVMLIESAGEKPKKDKETGEYKNEALSSDITALMDGFNALEKEAAGKIATKLMVATRGSKQLKKITSDPKFMEYCKVNNIHVFEILSGHSEYTLAGMKVDGIKINDRKVFLNELNSVCSDPQNKVIVFNYDILTEGIDISGITGVMLFRQLNKTKLIQLLGRASRIYTIKNKKEHEIDDSSRVCREYQEDGILQPGEGFNPDMWLKPYAWILIPVYGELGEDMSCMTYDMIEELRRSDFSPYRDIFIKQAGGDKPLELLEGCNPVKNPKAKNIKEGIEEMIIRCENQEIADAIGKEAEKIKKDDDYRNRFFEF